MREEIWKPIKNLDGYEISTLANVRSCERTIVDCLGRSKIYPSKLLRQTKNSKGYLRVTINKKRYFVHRLVAETFLPNPAKNKVVNHRDFNPLNNLPENLEWCTQFSNMRHSVIAGRMKHDEEWSRKIKVSLVESLGKRVVGENIRTGHKIYFRTVNDVRKMDFQPSCVSCCCNGKRMVHKGFRWSFDYGNNT